MGADRTMNSEQDITELGAILRRSRESRGLSVQAAAAACMLSDLQIIGLESANYRAFYSHAYARRAAERYAAYLGAQVSFGIEQVTDSEHQEHAAVYRTIRLTTVPWRSRKQLWPRWALCMIVLGSLLAAASAAHNQRRARTQCAESQLAWQMSLPARPPANRGCGEIVRAAYAVPIPSHHAPPSGIDEY